ncbi:hypothetical protein GGTG_06889 [Gaeumannomyces tritici R3-111a-1]|uniref:Enoyl reductase (ER) domain-containing protein n=1 Tax=Gaeumannomyces tritici (strain R3-111a-1) TaxID=644352 RepID=J3P042_GAET3|nr:hypothetical protein GGTG_06889 [Gaeumannomyces tritici R3-111a-1]EJT76975.1 hypothetical protein GGTG_06889 [Gaeumannomyces tritici R3-111a-1]
MTEGDLLYAFYRGAFGASVNANAAEFVGLVSDKDPGGLRIIEVGAGTGAADRFTADSSILDFATLDIESDPTDQGFEPESYDLVVAVNVLHATKSIKETLEHCFKLLRPGATAARGGGTTLGYGVDVDIRGDKDEYEEPVSLIISTKPVAPKEAVPGFAVISTGTEVTESLAKTIQDHFKSAGYEATVAQWGKITKSEDDDWARLRDVILGSAGTLWITGGGAINDCPEPLKSLMVGLARAIRNKNAGACLSTLNINPASSPRFDAAKAAESVLKVAISRTTSGDGGSEVEFASRNGIVYIPRTESLADVDANLHRHEAQGEPKLVPLKGYGHPLKLTIKTPGLLDTFRPARHVPAGGRRNRDVLVALGNLPEFALGVHASGVVKRLGKASAFKPGDRVITSTRDAFATMLQFPAKGAIIISDRMSFEEAASMPLVFLTAYYAFVTVGRLEKGETVLIHAAAGGVGQATIQIAQRQGVGIFATVGTDGKRKLVSESYGTPEDHIFSSRDLSFATVVLRATNGKGVDVVFNSLAGKALRLSREKCLAPFGRFLEIGKADLFANTGGMSPFLDNKAYLGVNLLDFENNPTPRAVALWEATVELIHSGAVKPVQPVQPV